MNKMKKNSGLTLLEILFACFIFLIFLGIISSTFSSTTKSYFQGNARIRLQNSLRMILDILSSDIRQCYDPSSIVISGPTDGTIRFDKNDVRKKLQIIVEYVFNPSEGNITRNDYEKSSNTLLSVSTIGEDITRLSFIYDSSIKKVTMNIAGNNPAHPGVGIINLETAVTLRSGEELLAVRSTGKKEKYGSCSFWKSSP